MIIVNYWHHPEVPLIMDDGTDEPKHENFEAGAFYKFRNVDEDYRPDILETYNDFI